MTPEAIKETRLDAEERYISYIFPRQSGKQHNNLKTYPQNDSAKGNDGYPKTRQAKLHFLYKYSKSSIVGHPLMRELHFLKMVLIETNSETRRLMITSTGRQTILQVSLSRRQ